MESTNAVEGLRHYPITARTGIAAYRKKPAPEILLTNPADPGLGRRTETCPRWVIPSGVFAGERVVTILESRLEDQDDSIPVTEKPKSRTHIIQEWDGVVESVQGESFLARLYESSEDFPLKTAEIPLEEVKEQRELVRPGARFIWFIGYRVQGSTRSRMSEITFRKLPKWTKAEIEAGAKLGEKLGDTAGWYATSPTASGSAL